MVINFIVEVKPGQDVQEKKGEQEPCGSGFFDLSWFETRSASQSSSVQQGVKTVTVTMINNKMPNNLFTGQNYKLITGNQNGTVAIHQRFVKGEDVQGLIPNKIS